MTTVQDSEVRPMQRILIIGGFGIFVAQQLVDELVFNEMGNEVFANQTHGVKGFVSLIAKEECTSSRVAPGGEHPLPDCFPA